MDCLPDRGVGFCGFGFVALCCGLRELSSNAAMSTTLTIFLAPFALLLPFGLTSLVVDGELSGMETTVGEEIARQAEERQILPRGSMSAQSSEWTSLADPTGDMVQNQVNIERRVIIRVSPRPAPLPVRRSSMMSELPAQGVPSRMVERPMGKCVDIGDISGVQPDRGGRLMLFMRDQRIVAAELEKACSARDFYSGFYIDKNDDGRLCVSRDRLQSRSGAKCQLSRMRRLVAAD